MPKTTTTTVCVSPHVSERLAALAHNTKRSKVYLASAAIAGFVERNAWQVTPVTVALEDSRSGRPGISHEQRAAWMTSWDTGDGLPRPRAKR